MYYVTTERERLIEFLPKGAVAAEIGVAQGTFASVILAKCAPRQLHLVDPWAGYESGGGDAKRAEFLSGAVAQRTGGAAPPPHRTTAGGDQAFQAVQERVRGDARVSFHRTYSYRTATEFPDKHFDFAYIDGDHTYEYVLRDLTDYATKIKDDGLILGHDFFEDAFAAKENYGVIGAVNTFLARSGFVFTALTWEPFPTFVLAKSFHGFGQEFIRNLLESDVFALDLPSSLAFAYHELPYSRRDGTKRRVPSFTRL
jgi:hypothetical protein